MRKFKILLLLKLAFLSILRVIKLISHSKFKFYVLKAIKHLPTKLYKKFVIDITPKKREISYVNDGSFDLKILATAAPACYANIIASNERFDHCLATEFPNSEYDSKFENLKETKRDNTMAVLFKYDMDEIDTLVTDHIDDLPLIKLAKNNIIVNPNKDTKKMLNKLQIKHEILP